MTIYDFIRVTGLLKSSVLFRPLYSPRL